MWKLDSHETTVTINMKLNEAIENDEFPIKIDGSVLNYSDTMEDI